MSTFLVAGSWLGRRLWLPAAIMAMAFSARSQALEFANDSASAAAKVASFAPGAAISAIPNPGVPAQPIFNEDRIMGVMPDYQTVRDTSHSIAPLTPRQKWLLAEKETVDPFNLATAFLTAAESQAGNETPRYGEGWSNYGRRLAAAQLDFATQNYFSAGVLATVFHQDPRYFRKGPHARILARVTYAVSRLAIARQDSGREAFNVSNVGATFLGIAASNAYYPSASRNGTVMFSRIWTSMMGGAVGNLFSEFWPDLEQRFFRGRGKK